MTRLPEVVVLTVKLDLYCPFVEGIPSFSLLSSICGTCSSQSESSESDIPLSRFTHSCTIKISSFFLCFQLCRHWKVVATQCERAISKIKTSRTLVWKSLFFICCHFHFIISKQPFFAGIAQSVARVSCHHCEAAAPLTPDSSPNNVCMCTNRWIGNGSATILDGKRPAGITPEVNLRNPFHAGNRSCKWGIHPGFETQGQTSPKVQNRGISVPTKRTNVLRKKNK